jgi:hypothetical protein
MLAWMGVSAVWQRRSFWTAENLMASVFYGDAAIRRGFGFSTLSVLALYLILYSLLGAGFAIAARSRLTGAGTLLVSILFSLAWYYLWFHWVGRSVMPLIGLLHSERPNLFGHVIYGSLLARFHAYLPQPQPEVTGAIKAAETENPADPEP